MTDYVADLGVVDYTRILQIQRRLSALRNEDRIGDLILLLQHPDTYTAGIHLNSEEILDSEVNVIKVERGGALTYHGPGQLVVYLIFNLKEMNINIKDVILRVQDAIARVLSYHGIMAEGKLDKETGVWIGNKKICSIGFAVNGFTTLHGIALNVSTDLRKFRKISPCGFDAEIMTSIEKETGEKVSLATVKDEILKALIDNFEISSYEKIVDIEALSDLAFQ